MTGWVLLDEIDRFATQALTKQLAEAHRDEQNESAAAWWVQQRRPADAVAWTERAG